MDKASTSSTFVDWLRASSLLNQLTQQTDSSFYRSATARVLVPMRLRAVSSENARQLVRSELTGRGFTNVTIKKYHAPRSLLPGYLVVTATLF